MCGSGLRSRRGYCCLINAIYDGSSKSTFVLENKYFYTYFKGEFRPFSLATPLKRVIFVFLE